MEENGALLNYSITWRVNRTTDINENRVYGASSASVAAKEKKYTIKDLRACVLYDIEVFASTKVGPGPAAKIIEQTETEGEIAMYVIPALMIHGC